MRFLRLDKKGRVFVKQNNGKFENNKEIDLTQMWHIFLKYIWAILAIAIITGLCAFGYSKMFVKPTYISYFTAYVNNKIADTGVNTSTSDLSASMGLVYVYEDIMTSRSVLMQAADACGTNYSKVAGSVRASVSETAPVVTVIVETTDKKLSLKLAKAIAEIAPIKVAEVVDGSSMRIIDEPLAPKSPASPNHTKKFVNGFLVGFALAALVLVLRDMIYDTVQSGEDVERRYGVPAIGHIPDFFQAERQSEHYGYKITGGNRR